MEVTIEKSEYGFWVKRDCGARGVRQTFIRASQQEMHEFDLLQMEKTKRAFKNGTHEKAYYYRDEQGTICIPPDPALVPEGYQLETIDTLASADRVSKEMAAQHYERYQDNGAFTEMMEHNMGGPRKALIERMQNPKSNYERDMVREMIKALDSNSMDLTRIDSNAFFRWRES